MSLGLHPGLHLFPVQLGSLLLTTLMPVWLIPVLPQVVPVAIIWSTDFSISPAVMTVLGHGGSGVVPGPYYFTPAQDEAPLRAFGWSLS